MDHTNLLNKKWRTDHAPFINLTFKNNVTRFFFLNNVILILTYICIGTSYDKGITYKKG
jgi:hypothetical protein